jgi:hypothetical protein
MNSAPVLLEATPRDMVWGVMQTEGRYEGMRIGEIWFDAGPLLIKFITTADKLSVQVHPDDAYASRHEAHRGGRGKTEIWYVVAAAPGARIAIGFSGGISRDHVRRAAQEGTLEQELCWLDAHAGETIFVPAGTVHAMGAGLTICEIQQQCDITYRLYDYGRLDRGKPRELAGRGSRPGAGRGSGGVAVSREIFSGRAVVGGQRDRSSRGTLGDFRRGRHDRRPAV